ADGYRHPHLLQDAVAQRLGEFLQRALTVDRDAEEELVDRVVLDLGGKFADDIEHQAGEDLIPAEVALEVDAVWALDDRLPDGIAGFDAGRFHLIAFGNDKGALVAQDAHRLAQKESVAHPLCRDVETISVEVAHHRRHAHAPTPPLAYRWEIGLPQS